MSDAGGRVRTRKAPPENLHLDLDVHPCRKGEIGERLDDLRRRRVDVDEALVDAHLELFP